MKQYLDLCQRIIDEGVWVENQRTGKRCLTVVNADMEYDVGGNQFPLITTRKSFWKGAVAELLGFLGRSGCAVSLLTRVSGTAPSPASPAAMS